MDIASVVVLLAVVGLLGFLIGRWHTRTYHVRITTVEDLLRRAGERRG